MHGRNLKLCTNVLYIICNIWSNWNRSALFTPTFESRLKTCPNHPSLDFLTPITMSSTRPIRFLQILRLCSYYLKSLYISYVSFSCPLLPISFSFVNGQFSLVHQNCPRTQSILHPSHLQ